MGQMQNETRRKSARPFGRMRFIVEPPFNPYPAKAGPEKRISICFI
jgi:hypothetical protein